MTAYQISPDSTNVIATTLDSLPDSPYLEKQPIWNISMRGRSQTIRLNFVDISFVTGILLVLLNCVALTLSFLDKLKIHPFLFINLLIMSLGITITIYIKTKRAKPCQEIYH